MDLYNEEKKVDTIYIQRYSLAEVRRLLDLLGLKRDESRTYEKL